VKGKAPRLAKTFAWTRHEGKVTEVVRHEDDVLEDEAPRWFTRDFGAWRMLPMSGHNILVLVTSMAVVVPVVISVVVPDLAADDIPALVVSVVVVGTPLVDIHAAVAVFLGLARRQPAVTPAGLFPFAPSCRACVTVVGTVLVSFATLPAVIVALACVRVAFALVLICPCGWRS